MKLLKIFRYTRLETGPILKSGKEKKQVIKKIVGRFEYFDVDVKGYTL